MQLLLNPTLGDENVLRDACGVMRAKLAHLTQI